MNNKRLEELTTRAMDECLSGEDEREYALYLKTHPEAVAEVAAYKRIRTALRAEIPASQEPPYPDFFNSHLERMVRESEEKSGQAPAKKSWWASYGTWLVPASAAAILAFFAGMQIAPPIPSTVVATDVALPAVYSPIASVHAEAVQDAGLGGALIILDGLDDLPDSVDLMQAAGGPIEDDAVLVSSEGIY
jgi:anti-sigma factor RsiW